MGKWKACTCAMGNSNPSETLCTWTGDFMIFNLGSLQKKEGLHPSLGCVCGAGGDTAAFRAHA